MTAKPARRAAVSRAPVVTRASHDEKSNVETSSWHLDARRAVAADGVVPAGSEEGRYDYLVLESTGIGEPLPVADVGLLALTFAHAAIDISAPITLDGPR